MLTVCKLEPTPGGVGIREGTKRDPGPGEILIKVAAAGICGTDMQIYYWAPRMRSRMTLPRVMGHEVSGVVAAVGAGVSHPREGDHVSLESHIFCGQCKPCRSGRAHLCRDVAYPGIDIDGGFAEYLTVPAQIAWVNPPDLAHETAVMLEPFGIAVHAAQAGFGVDGRSVLINGCGPIGLMNVAAAKAMGAALVIACDLNPRRLATAEIMGADRVVDAASEDIAQVVAEATDGDGVDVAIEYSGSEAGFRAAWECVAKGGDLRLVGAPPEPIEIDFTQWLRKCPTMQNIHGRLIWQTWEAAADMVHSGKVDLAPILSHTLPLAEALRGFELIRDGEAVKPIIVPGMET